MLQLTPGRYIFAVSGGVDSMVLLDMARQLSGVTIVVAHVNHGIRQDVHKDLDLVAQYCKQYGLELTTTDLALGVGTSEDTARRARYEFLQLCRKKYNAHAIVLAHHQDDLIETAIINIMRGTGWRGVAPFAERSDIVRPLLDYTKDQLIGYARAHHVPWREDSTNTDESYLRNYVRHTICPTLDQKDAHWRETFLQNIRKQRLLRRKIDDLSATLQSQVEVLEGSRTIYLRYPFIMMPPPVAYELLQQVCRTRTGNSVPAPLAWRALHFVKTARPSKRMELSAQWQLRVSVREFIVEPRHLVVSYNKQ